MSRFKEIEGYEGYHVSEEGDIRSSKYNEPRILKPRKNSRGYLYVNLRKNGKTKSKTVHRIVAEQLLPNPDDLPQVNHIDGNKTNNKLNNLEWCSASYNMKHAHNMGLNKTPNSVGENNGFAKITNKQAMKVKRLINIGHANMKQISEWTGISYSIVRSIKRGTSWAHLK